MLAVRFQHVREDIGGTPDDWDADRFRAWALPLEAGPIAVIMQAKTGDDPDHGQAFATARVKSAVERTGLWPADAVGQLVDELGLPGRASAEARGIRIAKLLITSNPCGCDEHLEMAMRDAVVFIRERFRKYREKPKDRLFFHDELIQFLASVEDHG